MKWGVYDTRDNVWMGDDSGPKLFNDQLLARCAAQILDMRLRQAPGRTKAREYTTPATQLRDSITPPMTTLQALKKFEGGGL